MLKFNPVVKNFLLLTLLALASFPACLKAFDLQQANAELETVFSSNPKDQTLIQLEATMQTLNRLKKGSQDCMDEAQSQIEKLNAELPEIDPDNPPSLTRAQEYLVGKRAASRERLSQCRLINLRAIELLDEYSEKAQKIKATKIFSKNPPIWQALITLSRQYSTDAADRMLSTFDIKQSEHITGILITTFMIVLFFSLLLKRWITGLITFSGEKSTLQIKCQNAYQILANHSTSLLFFLGLGLVFYAYSFAYDIGLPLSNISFILVCYILATCVSEFVFIPPLGSGWPNHLSQNSAQTIHKHTSWLFLVCTLGAIYILIVKPHVADDIHGFLSNIYYMLLALTFFKLLVHLTELFETIKTRRRISVTYQTVIFLLACSVVLMILFGFYEFAIYVLEGLLFTSIYLFVALSIYIIALTLLESLVFSQSKIKTQFFKMLSLQSKDVVFEVTILKIVLFLTIWGGFLVCVNRVWSLSEAWAIEVSDATLHGFVLMDTKIIPTQLILGLLCFSLAILLVKIIRGHLHTQASASLDATQEAYITIMSYVAYGFVLVLSLLVAGIDIKGLALIAGALSVGIGFGLQNIVNNFVSGLVLLLERPVKKGDRIVVGEKEGYVTHVGIRSTRISLVENADVIVPNSDLVSNKVTNFMYNNKSWCNGVNVAVEFGTDTRKVEKLLIQAANKVDDIVKEGPDAPVVFFLKMIDGVLIFQLWYKQENVNLKFFVQSDVLHAIDEEFKANDIKISFPQTGLHIKDSVTLPIGPQLPDGAST